MAKDTAKETVAQIVPGQLSERGQRIAAGLALLREGKSLNKAAQAAQVPRSTLARYRDGLSKLGQSEARETNLEEVESLSFEIAKIAGERIRESMTQEPEEWKPGDLVKAYNSGANQAATLSGKTASGNSNAFASVFAGLKDMGLTITPETKTVEAEVVEKGDLSGDKECDPS